jgi:hypothetical protein
LEAEKAFVMSLEVKESPAGHTGLGQTFMAMKHHTEGLKELEKAATLMQTKKRRPWPPAGRTHLEGIVPRPAEEAKFSGMGSTNYTGPVDRWRSED